MKDTVTFTICLVILTHAYRLIFLLLFVVYSLCTLSPPHSPAINFIAVVISSVTVIQGALGHGPCGFLHNYFIHDT